MPIRVTIQQAALTTAVISTTTAACLLTTRGNAFAIAAGISVIAWIGLFIRLAHDSIVAEIRQHHDEDETDRTLAALHTRTRRN